MKYIYNTLKNNEKYNFTKRKRKNTVKHEQNKKIDLKLIRENLKCYKQKKVIIIFDIMHLIVFFLN